MFRNPFIGGVLLVAGTTIGAGMLALPVVSGFVGFIPSLVTFLISWLVMLTTGFFLLDTNLAVKGESNFISMVHSTLGTWGRNVSWVLYLVLLYVLTAAYIAASAPLFSAVMLYLTGHLFPFWISCILLSIIFGGFVYLGIWSVDIVNRFLMLGLGVSYLLLIIFLPSYVESGLLSHINWSLMPGLFPVVITSFGYHIIIPSLTTYVNHSRKKLFWILLIGSMLPLLVYILWQLLILGIIPIKGEASLGEAWNQGFLATQPLTRIVAHRWVKGGAQCFSFFAILTSFLGVTLSLSDFLMDGLKIKKSWDGRFLSCLLTFVPPLFFVFTYQRGFLVALEYAGACIAVLLIFFPAMMAWKLKKPRFYTTFWGKALIMLVMLFALFIVVVDVLEQLGYFRPFVLNSLQ